MHSLLNWPERMIINFMNASVLKSLSLLFKLLSSLQEHSIAEDIKCDTAHPEE